MAVFLLQGLSSVGTRSDVATVSVSTWPCLGFRICPTYTVTVFEDGRVLVFGQRYTHVMGQNEHRVPKENVEKIIALLSDIRFFDLHNTYETPGVDLPSFMVTADVQNRHRTVIHDVAGFVLDPLPAFGNLVRSIIHLSDSEELVAVDPRHVQPEDLSPYRSPEPTPEQRRKVQQLMDEMGKPRGN
jgi:hypothetical protein